MSQVCPGTIIPQQCIGQDQELSHNCGNGDFRGFSGLDEGLILGFHIRIKADRDERGHVERMPQVRAATADEALAMPTT